MKQSADEIVVRVERACNALRRGEAVTLLCGGQALTISAAEIAGAVKGEALLSAKADLPELLTDAPSQPVTLAVNEAEQGALQLLRIAQLLPVAHRLPQGGVEALALSLEEVQQYETALAESLEEIAAATLPLKYASETKVRVFRPRHGGTEYLALVTGDLSKVEAPLVRVHSSCLTGDLLGSLRCDCGDQLHQALHRMGEEGAGVLCYLNQEGRGIGIANKIRAYALQDQGQDTLEANESLGFAADERQFNIAAAMLKKLGLHQVRLLTNNPLKVESLEALGITVSERVPLIAEPTDHNADYLDTKAKRFGHCL